ncbi:unnamed protein product [Hymenolepis diminuta]|uniref:Secreted protein n=1 Tax=Hymenolepis diminuta TaxID=6216 RepID=A0A0R3SVV2_HYMDI|nr:unnamed protein product [Hymenolepis diminuta]VUZ51457.1 unnamed protein product [Hymenolepis diminuta]
MSPVLRLQILLLSIWLSSEFLTQGAAVDIQRLAKKRLVFLKDAVDYSSWRYLGRMENYDIVAIPRPESEGLESVAKRGAYLDLPWG